MLVQSAAAGKDTLVHGMQVPIMCRMYSTLLLAVYCVLIVFASLTGGWLPSLLKLTHLRLQLLMSLVSGVVLGVALLHLLPHAAAELPSLDWAVGFALLGLLVTFFLVRFFHSHSHEVVEEVEHTLCEHDHDHGGNHHHEHSHNEKHSHGHAFSWAGLAIGLGLHTLIDGIALGANVAADARHATAWSLAGLGTFLAVFLHKPLDAMSITSLMAASGWPLARRHLVNGIFALMCPLGAALFWLSLAPFVEQQHLILGSALAFSAGVFLCISLSDLLPEVQFHNHDRWKLSAALLLGVALAYGIGYLEPAHSHSHAGEAHESHDHHGHKH